MPQETSASSGNPPLRILHLSDLHIKAGINALDSNLVGLFSAKFPVSPEKYVYPDIIIVTGDIFDRTLTEPPVDKTTISDVITNTVAFFEKLVTEFEKKYKKPRLFFVPGNHEIQREVGGDRERFNLYIQFLTALDNKVGNINYNPCTCVPCNYDTKEYSPFVVEYLKNHNVLLLGLVSSCYFDSVPSEQDLENCVDSIEKVFENGHVSERRSEIKAILGTMSKFYSPKSRAIVGERQIKCLEKRIAEKMGNNWFQDVERRNTFVIAFLHNNLFPSEQGKKDVDSNVVVDLDRLLRFLKENKCELILHGHQHLNAVRETFIHTNALIEGETRRIVPVITCNTSCLPKGSQHSEAARFMFIEILNSEFCAHEYQIVRDGCEKNRTYNASLPLKDFRYPIQGTNIVVRTFSNSDAMREHLVNTLHTQAGCKKEEKVWVHWMGRSGAIKDDTMRELEQLGNDGVSIDLLIDDDISKEALEQMKKLAIYDTVTVKPSVEQKDMKPLPRLLGIGDSELMIILSLKSDKYEVISTKDNETMSFYKSEFLRRFKTANEISQEKKQIIP